MYTVLEDKERRAEDKVRDVAIGEKETHSPPGAIWINEAAERLGVCVCV